MAKRRSPEPQYTAIFHGTDWCYESTPASYRDIVLAAMRDRSIIAIIEKNARIPSGWKAKWKDRICWQAHGMDVMIINSMNEQTGNAEWVRIASPYESRGKTEYELALASWTQVQDRLTYTPQTGWRFTRRCFLCDTGIALKDDEVYGVGGYVLCRSCEAGIKRSRITVNRNDLNRKWNRYLKAIDLSAASH